MNVLATRMRRCFPLSNGWKLSHPVLKPGGYRRLPDEMVVALRPARTVRRRSIACSMEAELATEAFRQAVPRRAMSLADYWLPKR